MKLLILQTEKGTLYRYKDMYSWNQKSMNKNILNKRKLLYTELQRRMTYIEKIT